MSEEKKNAIIRGARLFCEDHGTLTAFIELDYGGCQEGFGGYALYLPKSFSHHKLKSVAGHFIWRCMEIADAQDWSKMVGKTVRVRGTHSRVEAIGHIVKDDWFYPSKDFKDDE